MTNRCLNQILDEARPINALELTMIGYPNKVSIQMNERSAMSDSHCGYKTVSSRGTEPLFP